MAKIHFTPIYTYPNDGSIRAVSICGLKLNSYDKNFINCTINEKRVNCKTCLKILSKAK